MSGRQDHGRGAPVLTLVGVAERISTSSTDQLKRELRALGCGRTLGRYTLLRRIAVGGMAEVYIACSRGVSGFEKKVAIKKILPELSGNTRFVEMLVDEARIAVSLAHPNIAQVYELGVDRDDNYFIVMEYVEGRPLSHVLARVRERNEPAMAVPFACQIVSEVAKGLDHAHRKTDQNGNLLAIVHRDVAPPNILISFQGDTKLIDFGIARAEGRIGRTRQGIIKGKLRYLAPEIASGGEVDHRADIFCSGLVLFEMLTGRPMYEPRDDFEAIEMARSANVRSPRSLNPSIPEELNQIVMRACSRQSAERYQTAKELHTELRVFLNHRYPEFVESEIADLVQLLFAPEIVEENSLDAAAEVFARAALAQPSLVAGDEPTVYATLAPARALLRPRRARNAWSKGPGAEEYQPLVSSDEIRLAGADGGEPMSVVLADSAERPLVQPPPREQFTLAPRIQRGGAEVVQTHITELDRRRTDASVHDLNSDDLEIIAGSFSSIDETVRHPSDQELTRDQNEAFVEVTEAPEVKRRDTRRDPSPVFAEDIPSSIPPEGESGSDDDSQDSQDSLDSIDSVDSMDSVEVEDPLSNVLPGFLTPPPSPSPAPRGASASLLTEVAPVAPPPIAQPEIVRVLRPESPRPAPPVPVSAKRTARFLNLIVLGLALVSIVGSITAISLPRSVPSEPIVIPPAPSTRGAAVAEPAADAKPARAEAPAPADVSEDAQVAGEEDSAKSPHATGGVALSAELRVKTVPPCTIFVDGKSRGKSPAMIRLRPGMHEIVLKGPSGEVRKVARFVGRGKNPPIILYW
jgi:eukaryotic-like serine/threonine-protein kinase